MLNIVRFCLHFLDHLFDCNDFLKVRGRFSFEAERLRVHGIEH
jgi:hypothetical protein